MRLPLKSSVQKHSNTEEIQKRFRAAGLSVTDWAKANNFDRNLVYRVIHGRMKGHRGEAHRIAVALGLKAEVEKVDPRNFKPLQART